MVTSKVVSKAEGRLVRVPTDPEERDRPAAGWFDGVGAGGRPPGRTLITENRLGIVQAAAGVDASNVAGDELALLPADPDASALALRDGLRERLGVEVAVVVTDTMGRAWRVGQTDAAIGASGPAGAARLPRRRSTGTATSWRSPRSRSPTSSPRRRTWSRASSARPGRGRARPDRRRRRFDARATWSGPVDEDLFRLGTDEAIAQGRREAVLLRRSVRGVHRRAGRPGALRRAVGAALTAPAPHHTDRCGSCACATGARSC